MFPTFSSFPGKPALVKAADKSDELIKKKRKKKARKEYALYANEKELRSTLLQQDSELDQSLDYKIDTTGNEKIRKYQEIRDEVVPIYKRPRQTVSKKTLVEKRLRYKEFNRKEVIPMLSHSAMWNDQENDNLMVDSAYDDDFIPLPQNTIDINIPSGPPELHSKTIEFNNKLKSDPKDTKVWLEFVKYQDTIAGKNAIAKKIAILEKAMELNNDSSLIIKYMELLEEVEDERAVTRQWDDILSENPSFDVWIAYLDYKTRAQFQYTEICDLYAEVMYNFSSDGDEPLLHLFYRMCWLQRQCGYEERGIALFQALLEYNLFPEEDVSKYWDSEDPRFGEVGSRTFNFLKLKSGMEESPNFATRGENAKSWYEREITQQQQEWMPLRKSMQDDVDDPFRVVLFDDVYPFLFVIKNASSIQQLISQFLIYLGLPIGNTLTTNSMINQDFLLHDEILVNQNLWDFLTPMPTFPLNNQLLLTNSFLFKSAHWPEFLNSDIAKTIPSDKMKVVRHALEQGSIYYEYKGLTKTYLLWLDYIDNTQKYDNLTRASKNAKQMLRDEPANFDLWNIYAHFLKEATGGIDKSIQILSTTISMLDRIPIHSQKGLVKIYGNLAEIFLNLKNKDKAIESLVAFSRKSSLKAVHEADIEEARQYYINTLSELAALRNLDEYHATFYNFCLLEMLTNPIEDAGKPLYEVASKAHLDSIHCELSHETILRAALAISSATEAFQSSIIKQILDKCLNLYPRNSVFLSVYVSTQSKFQLDNRLRRSLREKLDQNPSEMLWLIMIWSEMNGSKNINFMRSIFDDALQNLPYDHVNLGRKVYKLRF